MAQFQGKEDPRARNTKERLWKQLQEGCIKGNKRRNREGARMKMKSSRDCSEKSRQSSAAKPENLTDLLSLGDSSVGRMRVGSHCLFSQRFSPYHACVGQCFF
mmetsp:Transcript_28080/g.91066  ORF Transcript_28080/g.91066 Transcript_28080/m.91066 type:complete len:103 (+) Transcript_28080:420-728(+)